MKYSMENFPKYEEALPDGAGMLEGNTAGVHCGIRPDIEYAEKDGVKLHIRMVYPFIKLGPDKKLPVMIHIQGSGWAEQDMNDHLIDLRGIVEAGYVLAVVQYRGSNVAKIPAQVLDAKDAIRYLYDHADELKLDRSAFYVSGDSSGGHTCLLCWATWPVKGLLDEGERDLPEIRAFLDFYGPVDFLAEAYQPTIFDRSDPNCPECIAIGGTVTDPAMAEKVKAANPITYIDAAVGNAPLLIMHGNVDKLVPFAQSVKLYEAAKAAGKNVEFYCMNNADHGTGVFYCDVFYETVLGFMKKNR